MKIEQRIKEIEKKQKQSLKFETTIENEINSLKELINSLESNN
jgi:hypothetical protein